MADVLVTCITKPHPNSTHEHITELGNQCANWKWAREKVIASIDAKENTFYTLDPRNGKRADIGVVRPTDRAAYVRTYARRRLERQPVGDGSVPDLKLNLKGEGCE